MESRIEKRRRAALDNGKENYRLKREEVVAAAAEVFRQTGYEAAKLTDIAERVGIDRATLYYYFRSKHELFRAVVRGGIEENVAGAEAIVALDISASEKLQRMIEMLMASYERNYPHLYVYIQEEMRAVASEDTDWAREMTSSTRRLEATVSKLIENGVKEGSIRGDVPTRIMAMALYGMVNWTYRWFKPDGRYSAAQVAEGFSRIFFEGAGAG